MFTAVQPLLKLSVLTLTPKEARATEFVELSLRRRKGAKACNPF